ncbi:DUF3656 domain-containing protein [Clostridium sp. MSJ-8]|uniref:DUF3656 domain-containing U32 family peptidase n=1 Tax=Clostridium sp. MSJ-8 TaxID=2841510 RepID=UPI001C0EFC00|nr:U32 family peptidase [Clostridium sp. MSJ-8]MBU5487586.1 DUF3656 domain-containing protein [Clostridium sp. MSJ-8]
MEKVELLAPAGSMESLYAAVNNGADAVYLGGSKFSARAYASNFNNEKMQEAVQYCHAYNVKIYVTMNTLLKEKELKEAIKYVGYLYEIGVDALIVQDLGLVKLIRERYPEFEIHASTQMTVHNGEGAIYFKDKGFTRIVLSRELSLEEIEYISKELNIETEMFIHGALCVAYSGKCLMSSMIGGRSGNRGRCAQPCRKEYILESENNGKKRGYLLSPKDMCTIDNIEDIIKSNAYSLKIEGRMKRPEYVAGVVQNYRAAIDRVLHNSVYDNKKGKKVLLQLFNREGFSNAYLKKNTGRDMMSYNFPKNTGVEVGKVTEGNKVLLSSSVAVGDGIRYRDKGFTINKITVKGNEVKKASANEEVVLYPKDYKKGDILYRTSSKELFDALDETIKPYKRKIPISVEVEFAVGKPIRLMAKYNKECYYVEGDIVEVAEKKPLDRERIIDNLKKSGEYSYKIDEVYFKEFQDGFIRISSINTIRRELFELISKKNLSKYRKRPMERKKEECKLKHSISHEYIYTCTSNEQLQTLLKRNIKVLGIDLFNKSKDAIDINNINVLDDVKIYLLLPEIIKKEFDYICKIIDKNIDKIKGIITDNAGIINKYKDSLDIIGDYKLNIFNSEAVKFYREDLNNVTISMELTRNEIKEALADKISGISCVIYGKSELMVSEYCPIGSSFGGKNTTRECNKACMQDQYYLIDEKKARFKVMTDKFCRSHIFNSYATNLISEIDELKKIGIDTFRVDFKDESSKEVDNVLDMIEGKATINSEKYTKGHYKRGVE